MSIGAAIKSPGRIYLLADGRISGFGYDSGFDIETDEAEKIVACRDGRAAVLSTGEDDRNCIAFEKLARKALLPQQVFLAYATVLCENELARRRGLDVIVAGGLHKLYHLTPELLEKKRNLLKSPASFARELEEETTEIQTDRNGDKYRVAVAVSPKILEKLPFPPGKSISVSSPAEVVEYLAELGRLAETEADRRYPPFGPIGGVFKIGFVEPSGVKIFRVPDALEYAREGGK
ncbi:MAG: hypothetical protein V1820_00880 [archaeon]